MASALRASCSRFLVGLVLVVLAGGPVQAQGTRWYGKDHTLCHFVEVEGTPRIVVVEFLTHGELRPDAKNLTVLDRMNRVVPFRVLQVGPGDFCRLAFATVAGSKDYRIYHGGPPPDQAPPSWTPDTGLVVDTYQWKKVDLRRLASLRQAIQGAERIGTTLVPQVFHGHNPCQPEPRPFLSRYHGKLRISKAGKYAFFTSSQDCSFLLIDGKEVVSSPGAHRATRSARFKGEVSLSAGTHDFEYLHAASGASACMVAAWQPPGASKPEVIPPQAFGSDEVAHLNPVSLWHRSQGRLPDFLVELQGSVSLEGSSFPLVRVRVRDLSETFTRGARLVWGFGDGQFSTEANASHVYLSPGLYSVMLRAQGRTRTLEVTSQVAIYPPAVVPEPRKKADQLADYLPVLNRYEPKRLSPASLLQLVRVYLHAGQLDRAVSLGKETLLSGRLKPEDEASVHALAREVAPILRDQRDDPRAALAVWQAASRLLRNQEWKAECEVEAADIALNDLLERAQAKPLLDSATETLKGRGAELRARLYRVWGDWHARAGERKEAQAAYARAEAVQKTRRNAAERSAWRGAYSRSVEAFLRDKDFPRAFAELRQWQQTFPTDSQDGYFSLLLAQAWMARGKLPQAIAVAGDLLTVNPESPYADRLVYLTGECEEKRGRADRAQAAYQSLLTDYPGSPLVGKAKSKLAEVKK
jgi:TolA-binding protein